MAAFPLMQLWEYSWRRVEFNGPQELFLGWICAVVLVFLLFLIAVHVLLGMAAYHDALARGSREAGLWGLLIGFLGLVPGIVYLCVRGSMRPQVCCPNCGMWHRPEEAFCPGCGRPAGGAPPQANPYAAMLEQKARRELIAGAVCFGVGLVLLVCAVLILVFRFAPYGFTVSGPY